MRILVFSTYGSSLKTWKEAGILDRELELYKVHNTMGADIHIVTYGDASDMEIAKDYDFITVHCNTRQLHPRLYAYLFPFIHRDILKRADLYKTNQLFGAHIAASCAKKYKKPLVVRQGYGHYEHRVEEFGENHKQTKKAFEYEATHYDQAQLITFTTKELANRAISRHHLDADHVRVVPNYIVKETWTPSYQMKTSIDDKLRLVFYGRFTEQKNLFSLIKACEKLPVELTLIGEGALENELRHTADKLGVECKFLPRQSQEDLKNILQNHDFFVLPSFYEGHPKSLLETMAFGMPVLATNCPGLKEQIAHGETGWLVEPSVEAIREGVLDIAKLSPDQKRAFGAAARDWSLSQFSVEVVAQLEQKLFLSIVES